MIAGQLSIFDELDDEREPAASTTCPHCHHRWTLSKSGLPTLADHLKGSGHWPYGGSIAGKCENQAISLFQLGNQQHMGFTENPPIYTTDLLGAILRAKQHGCTDTQIKAVLKTVTPRK
ncbi:hypothetical protein [Brevibacterium pigmentatum]|uniref:hypothetical protein n=1 Tax=Brevibacterium pigmentatum TaxID=1496080 RepID=UPI00142276AC|nr:hypothetical protein [Brevibacterium pigmentatum]